MFISLIARRGTGHVEATQYIFVEFFSLLLSPSLGLFLSVSFSLLSRCVFQHLSLG